MDTEKNTTNDTTDSNEASSFKNKREQWESEWKAEFKRDWEKNWKNEWKNEWKGEWKKHNWKRHSHNSPAIKLEMGNGQTYSLSVGKLIFGALLLMVLPFKFLLVAGAIFGAYHIGRRHGENESDETPKAKRDEVTAA